MELLLGTGMAQVVTFLFLPWVSRVYDPVAYGLFSFYLSIGATLSVLITLRLEQVIPLEKDVQSLNRLLAGIFSALLSLTMIGLIISLPLSFFLKSRFEQLSDEGVALCLIAAVMSAVG